MKNRLLDIVLIVLALVSPAFGFRDPEYGFSIDPPDGWGYTQDSYVLAIFMVPLGSGYAPRISINVLDRTRTTLDLIMDQIKNGYAAIFNDFTIQEEAEDSVGGLPARRLVCTWKQGLYTLKMIEIVVQKINRFYDLGYIATNDDYDAYRSSFDTSLGTLSLFDSHYSNDDLGAHLNYPSGWAVDEETFKGMTIFYGPDHQGFLTNVVIASEPWNGTLSEYVETQKSQMTELLTGLRMEHEGTLALPAGMFTDLVYSYQIPGPMNILARATMIAKGDRAYSVVYTSLEEAYDACLPQFEEMLSTFSIVECIIPAMLISWLMFVIGRRA